MYELVSFKRCGFSLDLSRIAGKAVMPKVNCLHAPCARGAPCLRDYLRTKRTTISVMLARRASDCAFCTLSLKISPKVWRLETLKNASAEIDAWMSTGSSPGRNTPRSEEHTSELQSQ